MMQELLFVAEIAHQNDSLNTLFLVFALGTAFAALAWLLLWLTGWNAADEVSSKGGVSPVDEESRGSTASTSEAAAIIPEDAANECAGEVGDGFRAASEEEAASTFATELASGAVKQDPVYGILYHEEPGEVDDLKQIKGVGKVLEGKLNAIGVYRFKQISVWTQPACEEFATLLTAFKDRIYRDNWIAQAKQFHHEKYQ